MTVDQSPEELVALYGEIGRQLSAYDRTADALVALTHTAVARVPGAEWASISRGRGGALRTVAETDRRAAQADAIQYELGTGPCVDALVLRTVLRTEDLLADERWPEFARRAADLGVRSMLSLHLFHEYDDVAAGLNLYSTRRAAFGRAAQTVGTLLATHGALAVSAAAARERADQLQQALASNRDIGVAIGLLIARHDVTREQAFNLLRMASQNSNRRLAEIAREVADTGTLDLPGTTPAPEPT